MTDFLGKDIKKLGFGLMRLPTLEGSDEIDIEQTKQMVDMFLGAGFTYFDTAYVYGNGASEKASKIALVDRYKRDKFTLATKLCVWQDAETEEKSKKQFYTSLERTGAKYFDFYLLHSFTDDNYKKYEDYHLWDYVKDLKKQNLIKHFGFSFHASPHLLDKFLTEHPDVDFVQLQINYLDWEDKNIASHLIYETARRHNIPIVVMEGVKGGMLANPSDSIKNIFYNANDKLSIPSWAIRFSASLEGVITVLSGMSNIKQMADNISFMKNFTPLSNDEMKVIEKVQTAFKKLPSIPCTSCNYCVSGCPKSIPIPEVFRAANVNLLYNQKETAKSQYMRSVSKKGKASDCIACKKCESVCPQHIPIITRLKESSNMFE